MEITIRKGDLAKEKADLLVVNRYADAKGLGGAAKAVDEALYGALDRALKEDGFKGGLGETYVLRTEGALPARRVAVIGLGTEKEFGEEAVRVAAATSVNLAMRLKAKAVVCVFHGADNGGLHPKAAGKAMAEGALLACYRFARYRKDDAVEPKSFTVVSTDGNAVRRGSDGFVAGEISAKGTIFARDLVNVPGGHMPPSALVDAAREVAKGKGIRMKLLDKAAMAKLGMGGVLGVAQGSDHEPAFVHLVYRPAGKAKKRVAIVGKAVTFDSGGLSLKPANSMATMKCDMAGAAAVLGVFSVLPRVAPSVEVHGYFAAVENMPSGKALRPGDVIRIMNGKTVEVLNTDAEGRLTLADALVYANRQKPDFLVDLATLTGSCVVALGEEITGVMANDKALCGRLLEAAKAAGENLWELPLEPAYAKSIKSDIADLNNVGGKWAGCLTAGLFLKEFVGETPWAHLDIAGPAFAEQPINAYTKKGGTGAGVRTLIEWLRSF